MKTTKKNIERLIDAEKESIAEKFGITLSMPTKWDYAMKLFYRTKKQLDMYEELVKQQQIKAIDQQIELLKILKCISISIDISTKYSVEEIERQLKDLQNQKTILEMQ